MDTLGLPDLLSSGRLSRQVAQVSANLARVSEEVATGLHSDPIAASGNDPGRISALERDLTLNAATLQSLQFATNRSATTQSALSLVQDAAKSIGADLLAPIGTGDIASADRQSSSARDSFASAVSALNSRFGDRSLFAGAAVDKGAVAPADQILAEIEAVVSTATTSVDAIAAVDAYFSVGGGFDTDGYTGSVNDAPSVEVAEGARVDYAIRADADEIKGVLRSLALAVVGNEGSFAGANDMARMSVLREAAVSAINAVDNIIDLRARVGIAEERIDIATTTANAERSFLEQARNAIIARDPFEAATEFAALETQLQSVFSITARLSRLNLTNFL